MRFDKPGWWVIDWRQRPPYPIMINRFWFRQKRDVEKDVRRLRKSHPYDKISLLRRAWLHGAKRHQINILTARSEKPREIRFPPETLARIFGKDILALLSEYQEEQPIK